MRDTTDPAGVVFDEIGPSRIFHYYDPASRMRAVLVIDTVRFGVTAGGVRMAADLSLGEMVRLARAMTFKFAMLELPCGGAKAGIWLDPSDPSRASVMAAFLEAIRPMVQGRAYMAGADMGTFAADFAPLLPAGHPTSLGEQIYDGMPLEDQLTGFGVVVAARTAAEAMGIPLRDARVAIEGFGKVGAGAAKYFAREGARLVAVSTIHGTLHRPEGLDVERLLSLRAADGDRALEAYGGPLAPIESLLTLPTDILVPGARPDSLRDGNAGAIAARLIVPAANIPYAGDVTRRLHERGIVPLPDFVTNAGGVLTGLVEIQGGGADEAFAAVSERVAANVRLVIDEARKRATSAYAAGLQIARARLGA